MMSVMSYDVNSKSESKYNNDLTLGLEILRCFRCWCVFGSQVNQPKFNQRRISSAKFLGELYNYRMVESAVIFRTLFSFTSFGVNTDGSPSPLDPPEHLFRIRLVCTLLDTCGQYFDRGSSKKKLDCLLLYFQVSVCLWTSQSQADDRVRRLLWLVGKPGL